MASASRRSRVTSSVTPSPACTPEASACFIRSMAQKRFTAVGRVAASVSARRWKSTANCLVPAEVLRRAPSASPMAAATPMAGAPRMTMVAMAFATSFPVLQRT